MYNMLMNNNFKYDASWPTRQFGFVNAENALYPYTLDFQSVQVLSVLSLRKHDDPRTVKSVPVHPVLTLGSGSSP